MRNMATAVAPFLVAGMVAALAGCGATAPKSAEATGTANCECVPLARYNNHMAAVALESLHRIQIDSVAGLRSLLESGLALDVQILWASIHNEHTSSEDRQTAYS